MTSVIAYNHDIHNLDKFRHECVFLYTIFFFFFFSKLFLYTIGCIKKNGIHDYAFRKSYPLIKKKKVNHKLYN